MQFLADERLHAAVSEIARSKRLSCAVAFWGEGAQKLVGNGEGRDIRLICNLHMGGTNPRVIRRLLRNIRVKQNDSLHAKVYIGEFSAIVTSANASANGLGFEGKDADSFYEAGVMIDDQEELALTSEWFEKLWTSSCDIKSDDIKRAIVAWDRRQRALRLKPPSFAEYVRNSPTFPLLDWPGEPGWKPIAPAVEHHSKRSDTTREDSTAKRTKENYIEIQGEKDLPILKPGTWILQWRRSSVALRWFKIGEIAKGVLQNVESNEIGDAAFEAKGRTIIPFSIKDQDFTRIFYEVINRPTYEFLWKHEEDGEYFFPRKRLMKKFWRELKGEYAKGSDRRSKEQ